jgi:beta-lactam-binding protein with PASTA domain/tRNA A-37 threonylcarbamoyl transferase component Bud32
VNTSHRTFGGRYEVIERAGVGGMAEVYRARDELLGREVAVKVLSERFARDRSFVERFRREAQSAANLNHPNIVSLYDYGSDNGTYFIVMEYIDGRPLDTILSSDGPLMPERAAEIASDVAQALQRAHAAGLVHRDIKPSNIMITSTGQTKVTDFGIARAVAADGEQTMTQTGMVIGTAAYLSPEQAQGNPVDARSDVYSLGCVIYEMLTGAAPFTGDSPLSIAYKHVREDPPPPSGKNPDVPAALDAIVMKALAKNPDNRYPTAVDLKQDLERFLGGGQVEATPLLAGDTMVTPRADATRVLTRQTYTPPPPRRGRAWPWVLLALIVLALLGGLAWLVLSNQPGATQVRVPDLVGERLERATAILQRRGFDVGDVSRRFDKAPAGEVLEQNPNANDLAAEGTPVDLVVSKGVEETTVPDLTEMTRAEAESALREADLRLGTVTKAPSEELPEGVVMSQSPAPEVDVPVRTKVDITISSGPELVEVPSVEGQPEADAIAAIQAAGLQVQINRAPDPDVEEGTVISQDPAGGAQAETGDVVTILVSEGPEEFELPDVTREEADAAEAQLEALGLNVDRVEETAPCAQPPETVCRTSPPPGTPVSEGDEVVLFVLEG